MTRRITQPSVSPALAPSTLLTVEDVARAIRRHPEVVRRQARDGRLPGEKVGRGWFFRPERLVAAGYTQFTGMVPENTTTAAEAERSHLLVQALGEAGLEAMQLLDQGAIVTAVGHRIALVGLGSFFFLMADDGQGLQLVHRENPAGLAASDPVPLPGPVYPFTRLPVLKLVCETRRPHFIGDPQALLKRTAENLGAGGLEEARRISKDLRMRTAISAPMVAGNRVLGAITVVGDWLREADTSAMAAFANQTAAALEAARLLRESRAAEDAMVEMLAMAINLRSGASRHSATHADLAVRLGQHLGLDAAFCRRARHAMLLQDLGKLGLPDAVLHPPHLNAEERAVLMTHPGAGAEFLSRFPPLAELAPIVRAHHEWYNGDGYPAGMSGEAIPLETRLMGVINTFTNLVAEAPVRREGLLKDALIELGRFTGVSLDPAMVAAFTAMAEQAGAEGQPWFQRLEREALAPSARPSPGGSRDVLTVTDSRELRIIYRIAQEASAVLDLETLLNRIVAIVQEVMGYYRVALLLPGGEPGELRVGASSGYPAGVAGTTIPSSSGITGWVFSHAQPLLVPDISRDARYIGLDPNVRSELAFPLMSQGRIVGVLNAESAELNAFTDADVALMAAVGSQLGSTLEVAQLHDRLKQEAMHDPLTRLYNRRLLLERLHQAIAHADRHHESLSIVFIDVNELKRVNDTYGHLAGDALLREVGIALPDAVRAEDVVARYGGDEFVVLLASTTGTSAALVAQRIREELARHRFMAAGQLIAVPGISFGIASYPDDANTAEDLLGAADASLYRQKRGLAA